MIDRFEPWLPEKPWNPINYVDRPLYKYWYSIKLAFAKNFESKYNFDVKNMTLYFKLVSKVTKIA